MGLFLLSNIRPLGGFFCALNYLFKERVIMMILKKKRKENKKIQADKLRVEDKLRKFAFMSMDDVLAELNSSISGITAEDAEKRLDEYGKNIITVGNKNTIFRRLREALINPFNVILLLIAMVTYITDVILSDVPDHVTVFIIIALVFLSGLVAFIQGERSNTAAESLSKIISNSADVWRDGVQIEILMEDVVPGDVVRLSAGDMIPGDVRFLTTKDTFVAQAALTGESNPVEKFINVPTDSDKGITDLENLGFMGSDIISGSASGLVLATGNDTYFGSMAKTLSGDRAKTSFERGVDSVSELLIKMMLVMVPVVFLINGIAKGNWGSALLFSISIAVGLTPEMLPVIMTSTLARGAVNMSKRKVIVRTLGAIQTFGEMDVLCTDKTGTLTEDKIVLEKYMDVHGVDDKRILRHAYLNSYFQTGLKNLIDVAVINRGEEHEYENILSSYKLIDEIPFDFTRRRMSVVLVDKNGKRQLITKGAVEEMMSVSSFVEMDGKVLPMNDERRKIAMETYEKHNHEGLRMIAVAQKNDVPGVGSFGVEDEKNLVLIGFIGFLDPPKESAKAAIEALKDYGVRTVVLTGDSEGVAIKVCDKVGVKTSILITGRDVEKMTDEELYEGVKVCDLFAKLSPSQKERVVKAFQREGHTVGYMGDGINDAPALRQADVGISVDSAVDIAKETADIILLEKDLMVLEEGVIEGRKTFGNIVKYIKMAASGNFGNMISVIVASIFLPFLPMLPVHILLQNLLSDFSQLGIPFDNVDEEFVLKPRKWETGSIKTFMAYLGPLSSIFDIMCFAVLWWIIGANRVELAPLFQGGWFVFGTLSQVMVIHTIRTGKIPFTQSQPSNLLLLSSSIIVVVTMILGFTRFAIGIDLMTLPMSYIPWLLMILAMYFLSAQFIKSIYVRKHKEWL